MHKAVATLFLLAQLGCAVADSNSVLLPLPDTAEEGGYHLRIEYLGNPETLRQVGLEQALTPPLSSHWPLHTSLLYVPPSKRQQRLELIVDRGVELSPSNIHLSYLKQASAAEVASQCLQLQQQLSDWLDLGKFQMITRALAQAATTRLATQCGWYRLLQAETLFQLEDYNGALDSYQAAVHHYSTTKAAADNGFYSQFGRDYLVVFASLKLAFTQVLVGDIKADFGLLERGKAALDGLKVPIQQGRYPQLAPELDNANATYYRITGDLLRASQALQSAVAKLAASGRTAEAASYLNNLAIIYRDLGNLAEAQNTFSRAIQLARADNNHIAEAIQHDNLGSNFAELGDLPAAERYFQTSIAISSAHNLTAKSLNAHLGLAKLALEQGKTTLALEYLSTAESLPTSPTSVNSGKIHALLAEAHAAAGNVASSAAHLQTAQAILPRLMKNTDKLNLLSALTRASLSLEDIANTELLLTATAPLLAPNHPRQIEFLRLQNKLLQRQPTLSRRTIDQITDNFYQALAVLTKTEQTLSVDRLGPRFKSKVRGLIDDYLEFLLQRNEAGSSEEMYRIMEIYQASMLRRSRLHYRQFDAQPDAAARHRSIAQAEIALLAEPADNHLSPARQNLDRQRELLHSQTTQPPAMADKEVSANLPSMTDVAGKLDPNEALIRYIDLSERSIALVLTRTTRSIFPLDAEVRQVLQQQASMALLQLGADRFLPLAQLAKAGINQLIIVPDHLTQFVPFAGLRLPKEKRYLHTRYRIVHTYSAQDYTASAARDAGNSNRHLTIFANPTISANKDGDIPLWRAKLPPLPFADNEANSIRKHLPNQPMLTFSGDDATTEVLLATSTRNARLLHIATHGFYDPAYPEIVGLLTAYNSDSHYPSGFVSLTQLLSQPFGADLVVLSGCDTLRGEIWASEGQNSLSRGILAQGAGSTLATLWKVPDRATAQFMDWFYQALANSHNSVAALQFAQQKMAASGRYKAPRYWAGFVLTAANHSFVNISLF